MSNKRRRSEAEALGATPIEDSAVAAVFNSYPEPVRTELLGLRQLIFETAGEVDGVGTVSEALKWGQPSYLTAETKSGSTIRIAPTKPQSAHDYGMYFICHTDLVATFRSLFGDALTYEDDRALLFTAGEPVPVDEVRQCVAMALTYHKSKR